MSVCLRVAAGAPAAVAPRASAPSLHVKCAPSAALAPFVEHYWVSRWDRGDAPAKVAASLLDPCVHLQIQDGRAIVMGVVRGTYRVRIAGAGCIVGVKFRPGGFNAFASQPAVHWTGRTIPADVVFRSACGGTTTWAREISDAIVACDGDTRAHAALVASSLDRLLASCHPQRDAVAEEVALLVAQIAATPDMRRVLELVQVSGRSERTLQRLFARYVGVSPAWTIRRYRLKAAVARLAHGRTEDVSAIALEMGYADQAHFIRDFRATIGVTPGSYEHGGA